MAKSRINCLNLRSHGQISEETRRFIFLTAQRKLLLAWLFVGMLPFSLQIRSYLKFASPHKITESLLIPPEANPETSNLTTLCPVEGFHMGQIWWNIEVSHYYNVEYGQLCHFIVPQYNTHGNYLMGSTRSKPSPTTPANCANHSIPFEQYLYHGSTGYFSLYEEAVGTYCTEDKTAYIRARALGSIDINGSALAQYTGSEGYIWSRWYCILGLVWLTFRMLVLRRSFISCKRHGRLCGQMGQDLRHQTVMVFVHESLRLSAHGANNYQRVALLYFLAEGLMTDLFVLIANDGVLARIQYISLGYNLSGLLLLLFEIIENMKWMREKWRVLIKRLLFCYESSLLGEVIGAAGQEHFISVLNRSSMRNTKATAEVVSYYLWSLVGHGVFVLSFIGFIMVIRALWAILYVRWKHGQIWPILSDPCSVDNVLAMRNKMTMLGGYYRENGKLYYSADALKAFGLLKMEGGDTAFLALRKINWFSARTNDLCVIGIVSEESVVPCSEIPLTGVISFFSQGLGTTVKIENGRSNTVRGRSILLSVSPTL